MHSIVTTSYLKTFFTLLIVQLISFFSQIFTYIFIGKWHDIIYVTSYGFVIPLLTFIVAISFLFSTGVQASCSNYLGKSNIKMANNAFIVGLLTALLSSFVLTIIIFVFNEPITLFFCASNDANSIQLTHDFIMGFAIGIPATMISQVIYPIVQLDSNRKPIIIAVIVLLISNIGFCFLNLFILDMDMFGYGLAFSISGYLALFVLLTHFLRKNNNFKLSWKNSNISFFNEIKSFFIFGFPNALNSILYSMFHVVVNYIIYYIAGHDGIAAYTAIDVFSWLSFCFGSTMGTTSLVLATIFFGEKNKQDIKSLIKVFVISSIVINFIIAFIIFVFSDVFVAEIVKQETVQEIASQGLKIFVVCLIPYSLVVCFRNVAQAANEFFVAVCICVLQNFIFPLLAVFFLAQFNSISIIWWFFFISEFLTLILVAVFAKWKSKGSIFSVTTYSFVKDDYFINSDVYRSYPFITIDEVVDISVKAIEFCRGFNISNKICNRVSFCIEEWGKALVLSNIKMQYGNIRIIYNNNEIVISMWTYGVPLNLNKYLYSKNLIEDIDSSGIQVSYKFTKNCYYANLLNINVLNFSLGINDVD